MRQRDSDFSYLGPSGNIFSLYEYISTVRVSFVSYITFFVTCLVRSISNSFVLKLDEFMSLLYFNIQNYHFNRNAHGVCELKDI